MFAKLYETELGQILVKQDRGEEGQPEVRFYFEPPALGVCSFALQFTDDDDGWDKCDAAFEDVSEDSSIEIASNAIGQMGELVTPVAS